MSRDLKNKIAKFFKILVFKGKIGFNFLVTVLRNAFTLV